MTERDNTPGWLNRWDEPPPPPRWADLTLGALGAAALAAFLLWGVRPALGLAVAIAEAVGL